MNRLRDLLSLTAQFLAENYIMAPPDAAIKQRPPLNLGSHHLLQAESLGAKLNLIAVIRFGFAPFVLHREGLPATAGQWMELYHIGHPHQPEALGAQRQPTLDQHPGPGFYPLFMHPLVEDPAFGSQAIIGPNLFKMNQGALPLAENKMLQGRDHDPIFYRVAFVFKIVRFGHIELNSFFRFSERIL
jgi:hypothetical protein